MNQVKKRLPTPNSTTHSIVSVQTGDKRSLESGEMYEHTDGLSTEESVRHPISVEWSECHFLFAFQEAPLTGALFSRSLTKLPQSRDAVPVSRSRNRYANNIANARVKMKSQVKDTH